MPFVGCIIYISRREIESEIDMILIANTPLYGGKARVCACINTNDSESATKTVGADFMPNELWCQFLTFVLSGIKSCIIPLVFHPAKGARSASTNGKLLALDRCTPWL